MIISMANGAHVFSARLHFDTARANGEQWRTDGLPYGVVLASFHGEFVTWSVWLPADSEEWQAVSGHYFRDYESAVTDFDNRPR